MNTIINKYKIGDISIEEAIHLMDKHNFTNEEVKLNGIIYTPMYIADFIVEKIEPKLNETVFEPSFGHGIFIFSLLNYMKKYFNLHGEDLKKYFLLNVFGQDINKKNLPDIKKLIIAYFEKESVYIKEEEIINFKISDTLLLNKKYDIFIGNPPYVRTKNLKEDYLIFLRDNFLSCKKGNIDLYYSFIELAHKLSNKCGFITPNSWLYNTSAKTLRKIVKNDLYFIIDFQQKQIFPNADVYSSIFLFNKYKYTNVISYQNDLNSHSVLIDKNEMDDNRWSFYKKEKFNNNFKIIKFHSPIATLRDKIYITDCIKNKDMVDFYKISKAKNKKDFFYNKKSIIFPYTNINNKYVIKKEEELNIDTLNYLKQNKNELNKRDNGKNSKYESWFAYGRKQGLNIYSENTFFIPIPGMISNDFKFFSIESNMLKKPFLFSSGFLLEVDELNKNKIIDFFNSNKFKIIMKNEGKVWKGKNEKSTYYSLSIRQLKDILSR